MTAQLGKHLILQKVICPVSRESDIVALDDEINFDALCRMKDELQLERDRLSLLMELTSQIVSNRDLHNSLRAVSTTVRQVMECNSVAVYLPDRERSSLRLFALDSPNGSQTHSRHGSNLEESHSHRDLCEVYRTGTPFLTLSGAVAPFRSLAGTALWASWNWAGGDSAPRQLQLTARFEF